MNIFVLDLDPYKAAEYHCDAHCVKMILESAQMLSTACRLGGHQDVGYKITHQNHPSTVWTRNSIENWRWLRCLADGLNKQYQKRYAKGINHKSYDVILSLPEPHFTKKELTPFAQCMPDTYKHSDAVKAYREYYVGEKVKMAKWDKLGNTPKWWKEMMK
jgi:hypothetical protein